MHSSTRSLVIAFGTAAAVALAPLALDHSGQAVDSPVAAVSGAPAGSAPPGTAVPVGTTGTSDSAGAEVAALDPTTMPSPPVVASDGPGLDPVTDTLPIGSGAGGLSSGSLPTPSHPQCPVTEAGAWWTDPADPYTCIPPGSMPFHEPTPPGTSSGSVPFHEPTPPGIPPELLEPIFETPGAEPGPGGDCRTTGALQCTVTIAGQDYVVTFADGSPVGVAEAR